MPNANFAIGNTYDTITRPVGFSIAKEVLRRMGFPENAYIDFLGHTETSTQQGGTLTEQDNKNFFGTNTEAVLTVQEEPVKDRTYEASILRVDNLPIFRDESLNVFVRPVYFPHQATLTFKLKFNDETEANRWRDDVMARSALMRHQQVHKVTYSWPIPPVFFLFLKEIFTLKENVDQTGEKFSEWIKRNSDPRMTTETNMAGKGTTITMPEEQVRVLGWFDFAGVTDKPSFVKETSTWEIEWSYMYVYDKPIEGVLDYPLVIRQQVIGPDYRPTAPEYALDREMVAPNNQERLLDMFFPVWTPPKGILAHRYPEFDTWAPAEGVNGCEMLWIGLTVITKEDRRTILDLNDLGNHKLDPALRDFLISERQYVCDPSRSVIEVGVYSNNARALPGQVVLDENLVLKATADISMEPVYHVILSVRRDLSTLMPVDYDRIRHKACMLYAMLAFMYPIAVKEGMIPDPGPRCFWTIDEWLHLVELTRPPRPGLPRPWPLYPKPGGGYWTAADGRRLMLTRGHYHLITRSA